jgi:hypothetical protein
MLKRLLIVATVLTLLGTIGMIAYAQTGSGISSACRNVDGQENSVVRIGVPDDAVAGGAGVAGCRVIHDGSGFVQSPAVIGNLSVIRRGVQAAVDVFGIAGGSAVNNFGTELQLCLRGTGTMIFLNASTTPRIVSEMPAFTRQLEAGTYTCTFISSAGVMVLVSGPTAPALSEVQQAPVTTVTEDGTVVETTEGVTAPVVAPVVSSVAATPLTGCRVTTTAMVRLRAEPNTSSEIITRLPYRFSLQATARTDEWVQVIWQDRQGWVSDNFLNLSAGCVN